MGLRLPRSWLRGISGLSILLAAVAARAKTEPAFPRLANIYLSGTVDDQIIAALARWDVVVISETWTPSQLQRLRDLNPQIKIFVYVFPMPFLCSRRHCGRGTIWPTCAPTTSGGTTPVARSLRTGPARGWSTSRRWRREALSGAGRISGSSACWLW